MNKEDRSLVSDNFYRILRKNIGVLNDIKHTFINRILILFMSLVTSVLIAKILGPSGRGEYAVAVFVTALGVQIGNFGLHSANTFFVARKRESVNIFYGNSVYSGLGFGLLSIFVLLACRYFYPDMFLLSTSIWCLSLMLIPLSLIYMFFQNIILGLNNIGAYNKIDLLSKIGSVFGIGICITFGLSSPTPFYSASFLSIAIGLYLSNLDIRLESSIKIKFRCTEFLESVKFGLKPYLAALLGFFQQKIALLLIQNIGGLGEAGLYSIATLIFDVLYIFPVTVGTVLYPRLSSMENVKDRWSLASKFTIFTTVIMMVLVGIFMIFCKEIILLIFGEEYIGSVPYLFYILPGLIFVSISGILMNYFASSGMPAIVVYGPLFALVILLAASYFLADIYKTYAPAIGMTISFAVLLLTNLLYLYFKKEYRGK